MLFLFCHVVLYQDSQVIVKLNPVFLFSWTSIKRYRMKYVEYVTRKTIAQSAA